MGPELTRFALRGMGKALPERRLGNAELAAKLGTDAASILKRTGIEERRVSGPADVTSSLGARAATEALERAGQDPAGVELVVLSTYTPDHLLCPTGPALAHAIGATNAGAFDLNGACSGGVAALFTASSILNTGAFRNVLFVASDVTTKFIRPDDPKARLVFGDGASALFLEQAESQQGPPWRVLAATLGSDGSGAKFFRVPSGGSVFPPQLNGFRHEAAPSVEMDGRAIYRFGVEKGVSVIEELCDKAGIAQEDVAWMVPHQANLRMLNSMVERCGIPQERWVINLERYGNTAGPSVPLALTELMQEGRTSPGDIILLVAFGAGLTWSGIALEVGYGEIPAGTR